ncbi:MAG TPA: SLC13 family permease [Candidatus Marinimicrobia bacterium]|nr:SLC13 family permease [Candidatus Neomarinimicrobiota bacterium]
MSVLLVMVVFFVMEILPIEVTAMGAIGLLLLFDVLSWQEAISGFSNPAVITIGAIFIMSRALVKTGFLEVFADFLAKKGGNRKWLTIFIFLLTVSIISGFINNTAAVAIFIPLAIDLCQRFRISPTKILLPLSYAAIFGGTLTLIGTSTNLIVSSVMEEFNMTPFSMFEFTKLGVIFLVLGTLYNLIISKWFMPSRSIISSLTRKYHMGSFLTEFKIGEDSPLIGRSYGEMEIAQNYNLQVYKIIRDSKNIRFNLHNIIIHKDDIFLVQINVKEMLKFKDDMKVLLLSDVKMNQAELSGKNHVIVEGIVSQQSALIGKTLQELDFRSRFGSFVLAVKRQRELLRNKIAHIRLKFSDTLLIMVPKERLDILRTSNDLIVLEELDIHLRYERYWWFSILVIPAVMLLATFGVIPIVKGAVLGAILLLVLRSLSIQDAYESISWSVIFLIASLIPLGTAIHNTNLDKNIGDLIYVLGALIGGVDNVNPIIILAVLYGVTFILSAFVSNAAVAVMLTPIGILLASLIGDNGIDSRPFLVAICFGASCSFMTPMGYQTNMMVYGPGQYRLKDFFQMGIPLTIIFWLAAVYWIPKFWPFQYY